jgi:glycosyltransferase involved in cell wall biosynthesis
VFLHRLRYSGTKGYFLNANQLKKLYYEIKPDVVNAHYASGYGTLARLARLKPLVLSVWGADVYDFPYKSRLKMKIVCDNLKYADQIASTSYSMANHVKDLLNNREKNIEITPFGVNIQKFIKNENIKNDNKIVIGLIKALSPKYGIDDFIKSISILREKLIYEGKLYMARNIRGKIYGDGEQKLELQELISKLGLENIVTLEGKIPNMQVPIALNEFDVFCSTSVLDSESFGVAVIEAMATKLPVVVTDVSGFKEVVLNNETGIIVERKNPEKIAEGLKKLILDDELRKEYGEKARKRVEELYNWQENVSTMIKIYQKVLSKTK